jgi:hypothetical protein
MMMDRALRFFKFRYCFSMNLCSAIYSCAHLEILFERCQNVHDRFKRKVAGIEWTVDTG